MNRRFVLPFVPLVLSAALAAETVPTAEATSFQPGQTNEPSRAVDGNEGTFWHNAWEPRAALPQAITIDQQEARPVACVAYLPRQSGDNGNVTKYNIAVSADGAAYTTVVTGGTWAADATMKFANFAPTSARFVRLEVLEGVNGYANAAEIILSATPITKPPKHPLHRVAVTAPAYRADVSGDTTVSVVAPGLATITATCWKQGEGFGTDGVITATPVTLDAEGTGSFVFPANSFPHGPITVRISGKDASGRLRDDCYLELFNTVGVKWKAGLDGLTAPPQAAGMTLAYADDFTAMPTISSTGAGATYCSHKPDGTGYADAEFADREGPNNPFAQRENWLRIRTTHRPDAPGQKFTTGFIASLREDGTGFHTAGGKAQYFECRLLYGAAPGIWPAFWLLSSGNYKGNNDKPCDEYDILENYMPWPDTYHIARHQWNYGNAHQECEPYPKVTGIAGKSNTVQTFHTYGCLIEQDTTTYYFDDVKMWSHPTHQYAWADGMYFMINNAVKASDAVANGTFQRYGGACDMWVDWVRVYQKP